MNIKEIKKELKNPGPLLMRINHRYPWMFKWMPDEICLKFWYRITIGKKLNLKEPRTFNEKLQWLKLYDRKSEYTEMVDKYEVKKYVTARIGKEYIIPTLGVWEKFEDINFEELPNQFVLKCTHDSGGIVICKDKNKFDISRARKKINRSLRNNFYWVGREWPYKNVKPHIIAEQYMENDLSGNRRGEFKTLIDYKFFCFNGEPKYLYVSEDLGNHENARISFVTMDYKQAEFGREDYLPFKELPDKPIFFEKMKELATVLSKEIPFLRVDFYEINKQIYFGELTFYPGAGFTKYIPDDADLMLGNMLDIEI